MDRTCRGCDAAIVPSGRERNPKLWCSPRCRNAARRRDPAIAEAERERRRLAPRSSVFIRDCEICAVPFVGRGPRATRCTRACSLEANRRASKADYEARKDFHLARIYRIRDAYTPEQRDAHLAEARRRNRSAGYSEAKRASDQRRRAVKLAAKTEQFTNPEIFERDGWRCGICGKKVNKSLAYPNPLSPSLDHVVPLSRGGDHVKANVRLAHLTCNVVRGNRGDVEQLALIG